VTSCDSRPTLEPWTGTAARASRWCGLRGARAGPAGGARALRRLRQRCRRRPRAPPRPREPVRQPRLPGRDPLPRHRELAGLRAATEGNGCAERFIRVLKGLEPHSGSRLWVRRFDTLEELRLALIAFRQTYNQSWIIERHGYRTPAQVRAEQIGPMPMAACAQIGVSKLWTGTGGRRPWMGNRLKLESGQPAAPSWNRRGPSTWPTVRRPPLS
jgi:hypothetical protein